MTSPQQPQPQPQPERGSHDTGAQEQPMPAAPPMPPAAPPAQQGTPPQAPPAGPEQPAQQPAPAKEAGTMMLQAQQAPGQQPPQAPVPQPLAAHGPGKDAGTMTLQAQQAPGQQPAPAREAGTMMLQAQQAPGQQPPQAPVPQPLAAHGPGKDAGTMMLQAQQAPGQQHQPQYQAQAPQQPAPPHPQQAYAGGPGGYVSPIPVRPTHLGHALASEWTKIRSVRSTIWTLGVMLLLIVGIGLLASLAAGSDREMDPLLGVGFVGVLLGSLCVITLGVLSISSEYGTGMIRTTLTASPSRIRLLTAKALVFFTLALVLTTVATTLVALLDSAMLNGPAPTTDQWLRATLGAGLYVALLGLLALAVGALLRHSAGAISTMMGVVLLPMLLALFLQGESLKDVQRALIEYSVPSALAALYDIPFLSTGPSGWTPVGILAGVTAVVLGGAYAALMQRDV
ncbi:ABC transporter permease subunit [Streptomyces caniferus]|uniref:ABC transporter permease subunit n=1 Tax=Streptomyces caniferus TaxID=285557 RepID=UPI00382898B1